MTNASRHNVELITEKLHQPFPFPRLNWQTLIHTFELVGVLPKKFKWPEEKEFFENYRLVEGAVMEVEQWYAYSNQLTTDWAASYNYHMSRSSSPPPTPSHSPVFQKGGGYQTPPCLCGSVPLASLSANTLADSLGVSPLYKQQDSARWNAAAQVYHNSRAHSPTQDGQTQLSPDTTTENVCVNPQQSVINHIHKSSTNRTPLSLEDIANMNRKRHYQEGGVVKHEADGPLELEAIAAVHELSHEVHDISVSEMLPRTSDLIFVNVKTQEGQPYTLELTLKGWRIASSHADCMNGDYTKVDLHTRYFRNARELLNFISPDHTTRFNECLAHKLNELVANESKRVDAN